MGIPLYKLPRDSKIYCDCTDGSKFIVFKHIDGSYSLCESEKGAYVHLQAWALLVPHGDGYKIQPEAHEDESRSPEM